MSARPLATLVAVFACCAGCIPVAFVYPKVTCIPSTPLPAPESAVRAFRIDSTRDFEGGGFICGWIKIHPTRRSVTEVTSTDGRQVPGQAAVSLEGGLSWFPIYSRSRGHSTAVKLYRPGYQTVQIAAWPSAEPVVWREAADVQAQVEALDCIWTDLRGDDSDWRRWDAFTAESVPVLLFLASEYDRLAGEVAKQRDTGASEQEAAEVLLKRLEKRSDYLRSEARHHVGALADDLCRFLPAPRPVGQK